MNNHVTMVEAVLPLNKKSEVKKQGKTVYAKLPEGASFSSET
jgi:hypothetical protein